MAKMSRDKGKVGEREVAALLRKHGFEGKRGVQYKGGAGSPDVTGLPGYHVEVKRTEKLSLWAALEQSNQERADDEVGVVFHRANGKGWVAILGAEEFLGMVKCLNLPPAPFEFEPEEGEF